jgi:hypothetical protein
MALAWQQKELTGVGALVGAAILLGMTLAFGGYLMSAYLEVDSEKLVQGFFFGKPTIVPCRSILAVQTGPMFNYSLVVSFKRSRIMIPCYLKNSAQALSTIRAAASILPKENVQL